MEERIRLAAYGREKWLFLTEKYTINSQVYVLLLPSLNHNYNKWSLDYFQCFLKKQSVKRGIIITFDKWVLEQVELYKGIYEIVECEENDVKSILQFYCLYEFAPNIVIGSLEEPSGQCGKYLVGKRGINEERVFASIVFELMI